MYVPKKVKLAETGMDSYNGPFYGIEFKDGVSVRVLMEHEAAHIGATVRCEFIDDKGKSEGQAGTGMEIAKIQNQRMEVVKSLRQEQEDRRNAEKIKAEKILAKDIKLAIKKQKEGFYSREQLEKIADDKSTEGGMNGLRKVGNGVGAKSTSMSDLINAILKRQSELSILNKQAKAKAEADAAEKIQAEIRDLARVPGNDTTSE